MFTLSDETAPADRQVARGMRLDIPAGTAIRFEPGEEKEVSLVELSGRKAVYGHRGEVNDVVKAKLPGMPK